MDRDCSKCINHTSGSCSVWECTGTVTVEDVRADGYEQGKKDAIPEGMMLVNKDDFTDDLLNKGYTKGRADAINAIKNDLHERLTEEMNNPYQNQDLCQGLYYAIQRCDWYLSDNKEQK